MSTKPFKIDDVPDLTGKVAIVTGGTSGIGLETAYLLARRNCTVHIAARSPTKADATITLLQKRFFPATHGVGEILFHHLDLSSLRAAHTSAQRFLAAHSRLDILIANAGTAFEPINELSEDGYDKTLQTNHLGHFAFVTALLPLLERTAREVGEARVVVTSSMAYQFVGAEGIDFDSLSVRREGDGKSIMDMKAAGKRYGRSKMANILFTKELDRRLKERGVEGVRVNACHPGAIGDTGLGGTAVFGIPHILGNLAHKAMGIVSFSPQEGAMTQLYLATHPAVREGDVSGRFYAPVLTWGMRYAYSADFEVGRALKEGDAEKLWAWSEEALEKALEVMRGEGGMI